VQKEALVAHRRERLFILGDDAPVPDIDEEDVVGDNSGERSSSGDDDYSSGDDEPLMERAQRVHQEKLAQPVLAPVHTFEINLYMDPALRGRGRGKATAKGQGTSAGMGRGAAAGSRRGANAGRGRGRGKKRKGAKQPDDESD